LNQVVHAEYDCQDDVFGSGTRVCLGNVASGMPIDTATVAANAFTITSEDWAGNVSSITHDYSVGYNFNGFLAPVDNPPTVNTGKARKTYPLKWQLSDANGTYVSSLAAVAAITFAP